MPHTVPKRPMKGVVDPVVARKPMFRSSLSVSCVEIFRRLRVIFSIALESALSRIGLTLALARAGGEEVLGLAIPFLEEEGEGRILEAIDLDVDEGEFLRLPEEVEKDPGVLPDPVYLDQLVDDDGPGNHRKKDQGGENEEDDGTHVGQVTEHAISYSTRGYSPAKTAAPILLSHSASQQKSSRHRPELSSKSRYIVPESRIARRFSGNCSFV